MCSTYMQKVSFQCRKIYKNITGTLLQLQIYQNILNLVVVSLTKLLFGHFSCLTKPWSVQTHALSHLMPPILRQVQQVTRFQSYFKRLQMSKAVKSSNQPSVFTLYDTLTLMTSHNSWSWRESLQIRRIKIHHGERVQRMINRIRVHSLKKHQKISNSSGHTKLKLQAIFNSNICNCKPGAKVWSGGISKNVFCPQICICRFSALS